MTETALDVGALRRKVRAAQHTRSVPLIILGVLLVNYGAVSFAPTPVAWRFGAPLAFVAVAVALRLIESRTGVGTTRGADYLVAGGFVFMATNIITLWKLPRFLLLLDGPHRLFGTWTFIVALALLGVALTASDWLLSLAAVAIGAVGAYLYLYPGAEIMSAGEDQPLGYVLVAVVGALLVLAGIVAYRFERAAS